MTTQQTGAQQHQHALEQLRATEHEVKQLYEHLWYPRSDPAYVRAYRRYQRALKVAYPPMPVPDEMHPIRPDDPARPCSVVGCAQPAVVTRWHRFRSCPGTSIGFYPVCAVHQAGDPDQPPPTP